MLIYWGRITQPLRHEVVLSQLPVSMPDNCLSLHSGQPLPSWCIQAPILSETPTLVSGAGSSASSAGGMMPVLEATGASNIEDTLGFEQLQLP